MIEFTAAQDDAGKRLDAVVAERTGISRAQAVRLIDEGRVTIGGAQGTKSLRLEAGMRVLVESKPPSPPPEAEPIDVRVVFEDEWLMVVSKPAGLVVHPSPGHETGTLVNALIARGARGGEAERPGIVHRLDAGTSGLMIVAKDEQAFERLSAAIAERHIARIYLALVEGSPKTDTLTIDAPIGRSPKHRQKMAVVGGGKDALTHVTVLERHARTSFVEARPHTGRTHQIRVHLMAAAHPVVGDRVYGKDRTLAAELGLDRPFLHAARLTFEHPMTAQPVELEEPLPADLAEALKRARVLPA